MANSKCSTSGRYILDLNFYIRECGLLTQEKENLILEKTKLILEKEKSDKIRFAEVNMPRLRFSSVTDLHYYSKTSSKFQKIIPNLEKELEEKNKSILIDSEKITNLEESGKLLNYENVELKRKLSESEKFCEKEKEKIEEVKTVFEEEKKRLELKCLSFSKLVSDFEKLVICEREKFEKERKECDLERKEYEKLKVQGFQKKCLKDDFERERLYLRSEVKRLTTRFTDLSAEIRNKQKLKSDLLSQFDLCNKERNDLVFKLNSESSKNSVKTKEFIKPNKFSTNQISTSNPFYYRKLDQSVNQVFRRVKIVWIVKGSSLVQNVRKLFVSVEHNKISKSLHINPNKIRPIWKWVPKIV